MFKNLVTTISKNRSFGIRYISTRSETIYALSSSPGKAGVAVIRISGKNALEAINKMTFPSKKPIEQMNTEPRRAYFRRIRHPQTGEVLDKGLVLWFPGPHSFTGEDSAEFQIHGGTAVVQSVLNALHGLPDFRMAEQGEFSKRAFDNDKVDLTELEGLADLLNAETEMQRRLALRQAEGGLRKPFEDWRNQIIKCMAMTEAVIDFGEDENIEDDVLTDVRNRIQQLYQSMSLHVNDSHVGEIVRNGVQIAIIGPPNAGKSTFLNRLAKREAAIVSDIPGTTRDVVEVRMNLAGYPVMLCDTAGLRESSDVIEMEGIKRAKARIQSADIKVCLLPLDTPLSIDSVIREVIDDDTYIILNKEDITTNSDENLLTAYKSKLLKETGVQKVWTVSSKTGKGVDVFINEMIDILKAKYDTSLANPIMITQARHREHLEDCLSSLKAFLNMPEEELVLCAEELRQAADALGRITGKIDVEDVLDTLFGQFCIGK
ncbi:hypothetical protein BDF20DRAFT_927890 [Mycotypha africana]|uniref:uncharacterized protein n=1 Tax=Mycotypha africana TaxID=64632 RepID=UPI002301043B|nr:uncharacterized protein BDF20DRAFT_927890 [Mycotypha africana]KAI8967544.1 hypothetical protein BDF20DRAFT_927890 [Mycotypha africana]